MAIGRAARQRDRERRARVIFGDQVSVVLDLFELFELAWHDCYGEPSPPRQVEDDVWTVSQGDLGRLVAAARLAVIDSRDLRMNAASLLSESD